MNEEMTGLKLWQTVHIGGRLWHRYCVTIILYNNLSFWMLAIKFFFFFFFYSYCVQHPCPFLKLWWIWIVKMWCLKLYSSKYFTSSFVYNIFLSQWFSERSLCVIYWDSPKCRIMKLLFFILSDPYLITLLLSLHMP